MQTKSAKFILAAALLAAALLYAAPALSQARAKGVDVSAWQGNLTQTQWNTARSNAIDFAFIRSSRGGTTGTYNQNTTVGTLGHRYDDPVFVQNMTRATAAGIMSGPYHFGRPDLLADATTGFAGSTGLDEANHMLEQAGNYMKPGYLRPVLDLEAGNTQRTRTQLTDWAMEFANRIYDQKGVLPIIYMSSSYANDEVDSRVTVMPLWIARYVTNPASPGTEPPPAASYPNVYGVFNPTYPTIPTPQPWAFWQFTSTDGGAIFGLPNTTDIDQDFANGDANFVREFMMPAAWVNNGNGDWSTAANWNGTTTLPAAADRTVIDRPAGDFLITLNSGTHSIKSLQISERFTMSGGSLTIAQYANFTNTATFTSGVLNTGSLNNSAALNIAGSTLTTGPIAGTGSIAISSGTLTATRLIQSALNLSGTGSIKLAGTGTTTSNVSTLSIAGTSKLDLDDNALVVNYSGASPLASIQTALASGYANGAWNGPGINSTYAAADVLDRFAVGFAEASDIGSPSSFLGQTIDSTSVLLRMTVYGDANLDGTTNSTDFNTLFSNYGQLNQRWSRGDFNFDGKINTLDFNLLASNFGASVPLTGPELGSVVPEPSLLAIGTILLPLLRRNARPCRAIV